MIKLAALFAFVLVTVAPTEAFARNCNPAKSKPCGMSCIAKEFTCHKTVTTSVATPKSVK